MAYVLVIYPRVDEVLVGRLRRAYDPTVDIIRPHVAVVYPVPETLALDRLAGHIESVLGDVPPFELRFGGLSRSPDHWLILTLGRGNEELGRLNRQLHTGPLAGHAADHYAPHLGLGHFLRQGATYDWAHPRPEELDIERYEAALQEARPLLDGPAQRIETLHLVAVPDQVLEWSSGGRTALPTGLRVTDVRTFRLDGGTGGL